MKVDVLAFGVHPDDVELSCGGLLRKLVEEGKKVAIVDLTCGELGSRGSATLRLEEAARAAKILGVAHRENLYMKDGFFQNDESHQRKVISSIRHFQPDIVLANALEDRHPDHGRAAKLVAESCFLSGLRKIETAFNEVGQSPWRPRALYHYIQDYHMEPDFVVDITAQLDVKLEAIRAFASQFFDPASKEPATPISGHDFFDFLVARAKVMGRASGMEYAEGFVAARQIGVKDIFSLH